MPQIASSTSFSLPTQQSCPIRSSIMSSHGDDHDQPGGENSSMGLHNDESVRYSDEEDNFLEGRVGSPGNEEARVEDGEEGGAHGGVNVDQQGWGL